MFEAEGTELVQDPFAHVAEGGMSQIVPQRDRLRQVFVEGEGARDGAGDLRHVQRVGQAGDVVIPSGAKNTCVLFFRRLKELL